MTQRLIDDLSAYLLDPGAWVGLMVSAVLGLACVGIGVAFGRGTGLLRVDASRGETVGLGLGLGLLIVASAYAALRSGIASAFTPVAITLLVAAIVGRRAIRIGRPDRRWLRTGLLCLAFLAGAGILYGITIAPSARGGLQPIEFMDEAFYAVLGAQLQATGVESVYLPAGFGTLPGLPERSWYHWGEAWLGALALQVPGVSPMQARHAVVLPLILLSCSSTVGAIAQRLVMPARRRRAFLMAMFGMLTIAPVPLVLGDHFDWWARPIGFTVTLYGLAFVVAAIGIHAIVTLPRTNGMTSRVAALGAIAAGLVAAHVLVAAMAAMAVGASAGVRIANDRRRMDWLRDPVVWRSALACVVAGSATLAWGTLSGHGFGRDGIVSGIDPFAPSWQRAVALTTVGGGVLGLGLIAAFVLRRDHARGAAVAGGVAVGVVGGAILWGARLADFNAFHIYFGTIAVLLTPVAVVGLVALAMRSLDQGRGWVTLALTAVLFGQGAIGLGATMQRLYEFGPGHYDPVPVEVLDYIRGLPANAKLAYACSAQEEVAAWDARLISLTAHTGRTVVPMCFQADVIGPQLGLPPDPEKENPFFARAPQRQLYPTADARPTDAAVLDFLRSNGIGYLYVDADHPNELAPGARTLVRAGQVSVLSVP